MKVDFGKHRGGQCGQFRVRGRHREQRRTGEDFHNAGGVPTAVGQDHRIERRAANEFHHSVSAVFDAKQT